jgi:hypothetical protein
VVAFSEVHLELGPRQASQGEVVHSFRVTGLRSRFELFASALGLFRATMKIV